MVGDDVVLKISAEEIQGILELARSTGAPVIDLSRVFEGHDLIELRVADWDHHPNAKGHRMIASALFDALAALPELHFSVSNAPVSVSHR